MMDIMMIITVVSIAHLAAWSLHYFHRSKAASVLALVAATVIILELVAYSVILLPTLHWAVSAAVFFASITLLTTCSLARTNGRSAEARNLRDKSR